MASSCEEHEQEQQLHFLLFPLMAPGHMIPLVDIGRLLARRGFIISIVTTPQNALRLQPTLAPDSESGLHIRLLQLEFPSEQAGLPPRLESLDMLPLRYSRDLLWDFIAAADLLQDPALKLFEELTPRPSCIISDTSLPYTMAIARKFHVPRISFLGVNSFFHLIIQNLQLLNPQSHENITSEEDKEYFLVPGLPDDQIFLSKAQIPKSVPSKHNEFVIKLKEAEMSSYGVLFNTFEELEGKYVTELRKGRRVWCVGPVSLLYHNKSCSEQAQRGGIKPSINDHQYYLEWLDSWEPRSVVYVSFGSLCSPSSTQLVELALGLESSNRPFIWVVKRSGSEELEKWMAEDGFRERTKGRGLLIWGWAPQVVILSHPAIGCFLSHCGANSIMEAVCSGVPVATWPIAGDQFINEIFVVEILKIGVKVGGKREEVKEAIDRLIDGEEDGEKRRERAKVIAEMAKRAVGEGGSSQLNIEKLVKDVRETIRSAESSSISFSKEAEDEK